MKMEKRTITKTCEANVYISEDGRQFEKLSECHEYEKKKRREQLQPVIDALEIEEARDKHPCDGEEYGECSDCRWYKVNNKEEVEQLQKYYNAEDYLNITDFPSIVFIECTEDEDVYYTTLEDCKSYVRQLFSALDVDFIK